MKIFPQAQGKISIPAPARGRTFPPYLRCFFNYFNSRPREGANIRRIRPSWNQQISIPAPARGRTLPRLSAGFDLHISIPAPARGRTRHSQKIRPKNRISIPAPARGRTPETRQSFAGRYFNSRPREGANLSPTCGRPIWILISIPAPARGRTERADKNKIITQFQFPPPRGGEQQNCTK